MSNEEIIKIANSVTNSQDIIINAICKSILAIKDADIKSKIAQTFSYLYCDVYNEDTKNGFDIFKNELLKIIDNDTNTL